MQVQLCADVARAGDARGVAEVAEGVHPQVRPTVRGCVQGSQGERGANARELARGILAFAIELEGGAEAVAQRARGRGGRVSVGERWVMGRGERGGGDGGGGARGGRREGTGGEERKRKRRRRGGAVGGGARARGTREETTVQGRYRCRRRARGVVGGLRRRVGYAYRCFVRRERARERGDDSPRRRRGAATLAPGARRARRVFPYLSSISVSSSTSADEYPIPVRCIIQVIL